MKWRRAYVGRKHYKKNKKEQKNSKNEGEIVPNRKGRNCIDCDANRKWILKFNQTKHNPKDYKSKKGCD